MCLVWFKWSVKVLRSLVALTFYHSRLLIDVSLIQWKLEAPNSTYLDLKSATGGMYVLLV